MYPHSRASLSAPHPPPFTSVSGNPVSGNTTYHHSKKIIGFTVSKPFACSSFSALVSRQAFVLYIPTCVKPKNVI